jgi:hypothetical protein
MAQLPGRLPKLLLLMMLLEWLGVDLSSYSAADRFFGQ